MANESPYLHETSAIAAKRKVEKADSLEYKYQQEEHSNYEF